MCSSDYIHSAVVMDLFRIVNIYTVVLVLNISFNVFLSLPVSGYSISKDDYMQRRQQILTDEQDQRLGGKIVLSKDEQIVNERLLRIKQTEIDNSHYHGKPFGPQINFLKSKSLYAQSSVFKLIQTMPKGPFDRNIYPLIYMDIYPSFKLKSGEALEAMVDHGCMVVLPYLTFIGLSGTVVSGIIGGALHVHDDAITDIQWLVKNVTYRDNCYMCYDSNNEVAYQFFQTPPFNPACPWKPVRQFRKDSGNVTKFDEFLVKTMTLTDEYADQDINTVWRKFLEVLIRADGLIYYRPVFRDYFYEALREFHADNVQYVEVRALLPEVYELDGTTLNTAQVMGIYKDTTEKFLAENSDFTGAKVIKSGLRSISSADILDAVKDSIQLLQQFPDHFAGYDLVGQEDPGKPLIYYLDALRYPSQQKPPIKMPYFFHAGETDWQGTRVDENLIDAVLLNTTRIGHGYALPKHPQVMEIVKQQDIAVEVNPLSNQILKLVDDMQNHPASVLLADGLPVVISSDDPALWGARGLTYDFYAAFMAMSGRDDGLEVLKKLSMNSLIYSALEETKKVQALKDWQVKWKSFIDNTVLNLESILIG